MLCCLPQSSMSGPNVNEPPKLNTTANTERRPNHGQPSDTTVPPAPNAASAALASAVHLFGKSHSMQADRVAGASAEIGVVFMAVTLVTGMLWGRITWGVYWQWDARLTTTALLFISYIGYLAVRGLEGSRSQRARRSAIVGLLAVLEVPLVHWSVRLWRSLHQEATVLGTDLDVSLDGLMLFSLFVGVVAFTLLFLWLLLHRSRVLTMIDLSAETGLDAALAQRRAEGGVTA